MMDYDVDSETPPSSPLIGYAAVSSRNLQDGELSFQCKGPIRPNDQLFSPQSFLGRGDLISTIKLLNKNLSFDDRFETEDTQYKFFNFAFDQTIQTLRTFIQICRKNIATLENLAQPVSLHIGDENLKPWELRKDVDTFLYFILSQSNSFRQLDEGFVRLFDGMRDSLERIQDWSAALKSHNGSTEGNKCHSAYYHYFHLNLELRWFFLILNGLDSISIDSILDDLIYLAWFTYASEKSESNTRISLKTPFNCYCVKELWTLVMHILTEMKPQGNEFWDFLTVALNKFDKNGDDMLFPLWLIVKLAPLGVYSLTGQISVLTSPNPSATRDDSISNCYRFVRELVVKCLKRKECVNIRSSDSSEVMDLLYKLLPYWGSEEKIIHTVWDYWCDKINKDVGIQDFIYWKSSPKWLALIKSVGNCDFKENCFSTSMNGATVNVDSILVKDEFFQFIRLFCGHVHYYSDPKRLLRLSSLHLAIVCAAAAKREDVLAIYKRCSTHFIEIYDELTQRNKVNSSKTIFTAQLTMILLLLDKSVPIDTIVSPIMERTNQLMLKQSDIQIVNKKDFIIMYIECLDTFSKIGSTQDLGQVHFFTPHISIWLSVVASDYISRTLRVLHNVLTWLMTSNELSFAVFARKIVQSTRQFLSEAVCISQNRLQNDVEPLADLAVDFTLLERNDEVLVSKFFEQFALEVRTCPEISQLYVDKILYANIENVQPVNLQDVQLLQAWIRLVCVGAKVPRQLTISVLSTDESQNVCQSNPQLLTYFCKFASDNGDWERKHIESILQPFLKLCEKKWTPLKNCVTIIENILESAAIILNELKFQKIYVSKMPCVVQTILNTVTDYLIKMPAELENVLKECLPKVFDAVTCYQYWSNDPYLRSQIQNYLAFAFTSFTRDNHLKMFENHPAVKILRSATETYNDVVLSDLLPEMKSIVNDQKLNNHSEYLKTLSLFSRKSLGLISVVAKSLPMVLKITRLASNSNSDMNMCCDIICSLFDSAYTDSKKSKLQFDCVDVELALESAVRNELEQNLSLHARKYFGLFRKLMNHKGLFRANCRRFLKEKLLPIVNEQIQMCEMRRGYGQDQSLRIQYQTLEADLNRLV